MVFLVTSNQGTVFFKLAISNFQIVFQKQTDDSYQLEGYICCFERAAYTSVFIQTKILHCT